jgi:hypothetical protein
MKTLKDYFNGYFVGEYDGSYGTEESHQARRDFSQLTNCRIIWSQVHGDFKNAAKRALFQPYPYWPELYQACKDAIRAHVELDTTYSDTPPLAKIMRDAMTILRERHSCNVPRWWLPIMDELRGATEKKEQARPKITYRIKLAEGNVRTFEI